MCWACEHWIRTNDARVDAHSEHTLNLSILNTYLSHIVRQGDWLSQIHIAIRRRCVPCALSVVLEHRYRNIYLAAYISMITKMFAVDKHPLRIAQRGMLGKQSGGGQMRDLKV